LGFENIFNDIVDLCFNRHPLQPTEEKEMNQKQSMARLSLYILIAMGTSASAGLPTVNFSDWRETASFMLSVAMTGLITARSYIDQTPSRIEQ
jgi:Trk-type K+ transport system membrane component